MVYIEVWSGKLLEICYESLLESRLVERGKRNGYVEDEVASLLPRSTITETGSLFLDPASNIIRYGQCRILIQDS